MTSRRRLPMFPLGTPLLPGALLPLHVFELRYRMMLDDVLSSEPHEFGIVMIERGHEVGGGDVRTTVGTRVRVVRSEETDDGRRGVVVVGIERLRVVEWLPDDPYPVAMVVEWPFADSGAGSPDVEHELDGRVTRFVALLRRLDDRVPSIEGRSIDEDLAAYVFRVATSLPIGPSDRHAVLSSTTTDEAARRLATAIDDLDALVRFRAGVGIDDD
ncbi:MAG: LON peptidase substrate-binding domain-containing protein [Actinomycetota bacterium]|nr:LON peptidase substrate-binding domain-containing protein [Actinomycetota bacterium]MDA2970952.1 LON peptidase substrate-binding domain-containing protein [Actinomycetota bacterium]MDA3000062.1 LON peptidase substrate-binding domain-containing protein [Actinomycetota bacterium]